MSVLARLGVRVCVCEICVVYLHAYGGGKQMQKVNAERVALIRCTI